MSDRDQEARRSSRSPPRKAKKTGGFKWKQKSSTADDGDDRRDSRDSRDGRRSRYDDDHRGSSSRGYRDDYRRDRGRDFRDRERDQDRDRDRDHRRNRTRSGSPRRDRDERDSRPRDSDRDRGGRPPRRERKDKGPAAPAAAPAPAGGEEMIIVHVNDRLGTKAAIPCLASDPVGAFKVIVAMKIGREPHQILLKRQGERPFKDHITLGDYGVSNGVQLDLEVDTGD